MELRIERRDLLQEIGGEVLSGDFGQTGNIVDRLFRIKLGALAAGTIENIDHMGAQIEQTKLEHGKEADRAGANNNHICFNQFGHKSAFWITNSSSLWSFTPRERGASYKCRTLCASLVPAGSNREHREDYDRQDGSVSPRG